MTYWWEDLSDDELRSRLQQRGMARSDAQSWVEYREHPAAKDQINQMIEEG